MRPAGGNAATLKKYLEIWGIPTDHFDPYATRRGVRRPVWPLEQVLVKNSTYSRGHLKARLYAEGLKGRNCELCGQGEHWYGHRISLILDHINGIATDHRLENLQIVCPNCAAALPTHCGRNVDMIKRRSCAGCGQSFRPRNRAQRYCSKECGFRSPGRKGPRPEARKVERPPIEQLLCEIDELGYSGVGRKYGVSDNAVRKWLRAEGVEPPRRTWPNRKRGDAAASPRATARGRGRARGRPPPRRSR